MNKLQVLCALLTATILALSCSKTTDYSRSEYLLVQNPETGEFVLNPTITCNESGTISLTVKANVDYAVSCMTETKDGSWITAGQPQHSGEYDVIPLTISEQNNAPILRTASLTLSAPEFYLGNFVTIRQGYTIRVGSDFSFLQYGSENPLTGVSGKLISAWTEDEIQKGWTSTVYDGETEAWCYGRNGYIQLGDANGHKADILTPYEANIAKDTVVLAYFNAVAHTSTDGVKDNGKITVTVEGGGQFADGSTSKSVTVGNLNPSAADAIWDGTSYSFQIVSGSDNTISANTRVRVTDAGSTSGNRVYLKNFYLFKVK